MNHHLVVQMLNANKEMVLVLALAYLSFSVILMKAVDQNAFLVLIVPQIKHVSETSAKILAPEFVVNLQNAQSLIMSQLVHVLEDTLEIHLEDVPQNLVSIFISTILLSDECMTILPLRSV